MVQTTGRGYIREGTGWRVNLDGRPRYQKRRTDKKKIKETNQMSVLWEGSYLVGGLRG